MKKYLTGMLTVIAALFLAGQAEAKNFYARLSAEAVPSGSGTVSVNNSNSAGEYAESASADRSVYALTGSSKKIDLYAFAQPAAGNSFVGWFDNSSGTGTALSTSTSYTYTITATSSTKDSPTAASIYAVFQKAGSITEVVLDPAQVNYDGTAKTVSVTVKDGTTVLTQGTDYIIDPTNSDPLTQTGSGAEDKTYTVKVIGAGTYMGKEKSASWTIKAPSGTIAGLAAAEEDIGTISGTTLNVTDTSKLEYSDGTTWYAGLTISWPDPVKGGGALTYQTVQYVKESAVKITQDAGTLEHTKDSGSFNAALLDNRDYEYLKGTAWKVPVTVAAIEAAKAQSKTSLEFTMTAGEIAWGDATEGDTDGVRFQDYRIVIPLADIKLFNDHGVQVYPAVEHKHDWSFAAAGNVLTATCNGAGECNKSGTLTLTLNAESKEFDGAAVTATLANADDFTNTLVYEQVAHTVTVGEIAYTGDFANRKYKGAYTASCTVTIDGTEYTLTKDFTISKPAGGYTSGYEVGYTDDSVSYDTFAEAVAAAEAGATIRYHGGNITQNEIDFTADKDVTVDLGCATLTASSAQGLTLKNGGAGKVTLINGTIKQPSYKVVITLYAQVDTKGSFVFGENMVLENGGNLNADYLTVTADGSLEITGGEHQANFAGDVVITGGDFTKDPSAFLAEGLTVGTSSVEGYTYCVIAHYHEFVYSAEDNVITVTCTGTPNTAACILNGDPVTMTLKADSRKENGEPFSATLDVDDAFPVKTAEITYWQDGERLESAPSEIGDYEARVTVEGATAVKAFSILDRRRAFDLSKITVTGAGAAESCLIEGSTLVVTNGGWKFYSAENAPDRSGIEGWYAGMTVTWPNETANFTRPEDARFTVNAIKGEGDSKRIFTGEDEIPGVTLKTVGIPGTDLNSVQSFTWYERITIADVKAATAAGRGEIERQVSAKGETWSKKILLVTYGDEDGVAWTTFRIVAVLKDLTLTDGDGYTIWPEHVHEWSYVANGHSLTAACAIAGCRYQALPVGVEIAAEEDRLCNGRAFEVSLLNAVTFAGVTDATVGDILYTGTDYAGAAYESADAPVQPGGYRAAVTVVRADAETNTLVHAFTIREGLVVDAEGQHYDSAAEILEKNTRDLLKISVWKDFTAEKTYVLPANGSKILDLAGKTVSAPDGQENVITNLGSFTIMDSAFTPGGRTIEGRLYGNLVNAGELIITGGYIDGTITNLTDGTVLISGGVFRVRPEESWIAEGCKIIKPIGSSYYYVEGHIHRYLLTRSIGGSLVFATCYNFLSDGTLEVSECDAREVIFLLSPMKGLLAGSVSVPTTSLEYNGRAQGVELSAYNLSALKKLLGSFSLTDLGEAWSLIVKIVSAVTGTGSFTVDDLTQILSLLAERGFNPSEFVLDAKSVASLTGIESSAVAYTCGGEAVEGVPVNAGTYRATMTLTGADGKSKEIASTYTINPMDINDAHPTITCDPASRTFQYDMGEHVIAVSAVTLDSPASVKIREFLVKAEAFAADPSITTAFELLSDLSELGADLPKAPDYWNDYGVLRTLEYLADLVAYLRDDVIEYLKGELSKVALTEGVDYAVGGTTAATEIGAYTLTVDGLGNYKGSIPVEWAIIYDHDGAGHNWKYDGDGTAKLTATCGTDPVNCFVSPMVLELVADTVTEKEFDGAALTASVSNAFAFATYTGATVGEVVYTDADGNPLEAAPKDVGGYFAQVEVVTEKGVKLQLKLAFTISIPEAGFTDGYVIGTGEDAVRYDTLAEAIAAAEAGAVILAHDEIVGTDLDFTTDNDVTVDLCGHAVIGNNDMTLRNNGAGTVTFVNGTIRQPRHYVFGIQFADQLSIASGAFVFGENLETENVATSALNHFTVTVAEGASLAITDGRHEAKFTGAVTATGGEFTQDPSALTIPEGFAVLTAESGEYRYSVIPHTHNYRYTADGQTVIRTCVGTEGDGPCPDAAVSVTLSVADKTVYSGKPVAASVTGGRLEYALAYYEASEPLGEALEGAPVDAGDYAVVMSVGDAAVTNAFTIVPKPITGLSLEVGAYVCDGLPKTNGVVEVRAGDLTLGGDEYAVSGDALVQTGTPFADSVYTVIATGSGNFTGSATNTWEILAPNGSFADGYGDGAGYEDIRGGIAASAEGVADGTDFVVTNGATLYYDGQGTWYARLDVIWPASLSELKPSHFTPVANLLIDPQDAMVEVRTNVDAVSGEEYVAGFAWQVAVTPQMMLEADGDLVFTLNAMGLADAVRSPFGIAEQTFTLTVPKGTVLLDETGYQVYPDRVQQAWRNLYFFEDLEDMGVIVPADAKAVKAEGLPAGLKLVKTAVKDETGRTTIGYTYAIEGVPTELFDGDTRRSAIRITDAGGVQTLSVLGLRVDEPEPGADIEGTVGSPVLSAGGKRDTFFHVTKIWSDAKIGWTFKGWPSGITYDRDTGYFRGAPKKAGRYTITATGEKISPTSYKNVYTATFTVWADEEGEKSELTGQAYVAQTNSLDRFGVVKSVSGLPAGLKFTAKDVADRTYGAIRSNTVYGQPTKAGTFTVKLTFEDKSTKSFFWTIAPAVAPTCTVELGDEADTPVERHKALITQGSSRRYELATSDPAAKVTVSGLPTGLSLKAASVKDANGKTIGSTYALEGVPTKAGEYFVTVKTTLNGVTTTSTLAFTVVDNPFTGLYKGLTTLDGRIGVAELSMAAGGTLKLTLTEGKSKLTANVKSYSWEGETLAGRASFALKDGRTIEAVMMSDGTAVVFDAAAPEMTNALSPTVKPTADELPSFTATYCFAVESGAPIAVLTAVYDAKKATGSVKGKLADGTSVSQASIAVLENGFLAPVQVVDKSGAVWVFDGLGLDGEGAAVGSVNWRDEADVVTVPAVGSVVTDNPKPKFGELITAETALAFAFGEAEEVFILVPNGKGGVGIYEEGTEKALATIGSAFANGILSFSFTAKSGDKAKYAVDLVLSDDGLPFGQVLRTWKDGSVQLSKSATVLLTNLPRK